jgi:hypothetical protein
VDDELDASCSGGAELKETAGDVRSDQHGELVELERSDRIAVGVEHVLAVTPSLRAFDRMTDPSSINIS